MRDQCNLRKMFNCLHLHVGGVQINAVRHHPVVRHKDGVVLRNQRLEPISKLGRALRPETRPPSKSTMTRSEGFIMPLHMDVGVARTCRSSSRTERLPSIAAT